VTEVENRMWLQALIRTDFSVVPVLGAGFLPTGFLCFSQSVSRPWYWSGSSRCPHSGCRLSMRLAPPEPRLERTGGLCVPGADQGICPGTPLPTRWCRRWLQGGALEACGKEKYGSTSSVRVQYCMSVAYGSTVYQVAPPTMRGNEGAGGSMATAGWFCRCLQGFGGAGA